MSTRNRLFAGVLAIALGVGFTIPASADSEDGAVARLESRADHLAREIHRLPSKGGASTRVRLHQQLRDVEREIARIEQGGSANAERMAALLGEHGTRHDSRALVRRADARHKALERRLAAGAKLGAIGRLAVEEDIERLDQVISAIESGRDVKAETLNAALGGHVRDSARSPGERLQAHQTRVASLERRLTGHKMGVVTRAEVRDEIDDLEAEIARLEDQIGQ